MSSPPSVVPEDVDRDDLRMVYQSVVASLLDYRARTWETIKAAALLFTGILAATGGIAARHDTPFLFLAYSGWR